MTVMDEFVELSEKLKNYGFDTRELRPFALTQLEAAEAMEQLMSDQPLPQVGMHCELLGVRCVIVDDRWL